MKNLFLLVAYSCSLLLVTPILFAILIFSIGVTSYAQTNPLPKTVSAGILNGKALSLPKPVYPEDARRSKVTGVVKVETFISELRSYIY